MACAGFLSWPGFCPVAAGRVAWTGAAAAGFAMGTAYSLLLRFDLSSSGRVVVTAAAFTGSGTGGIMAASLRFSDAAAVCTGLESFAERLPLTISILHYNRITALSLTKACSSG